MTVNEIVKEIATLSADERGSLVDILKNQEGILESDFQNALASVMKKYDDSLRELAK